MPCAMADNTSDLRTLAQDRMCWQTVCPFDHVELKEEMFNFHPRERKQDVNLAAESTPLHSLSTMAESD